MDIEEQKAAADIVLEKLESVDPNCMLAGGAPRDWYLGKKANDLDFYIHLPDYNQASVIKIQLERSLGVKLTQLGSGTSNEYYSNMEHLRAVWECNYNGMKVQIIIMSAPILKSVIPEFGTSICKIWYKAGVIEVTEDFLFSLDSKTIFFKESFTCKEKHLLKMRAYFPKFSFKSYSHYDKCFEKADRKTILKIGLIQKWWRMLKRHL